MASGLMTIYAPGTFASLRRRFEVTDRKYSKVRLFRAQKVPRNPAARFSSRDGGYLVNTIKKNEARHLRAIFPRYYKYMPKHSHDSLVTRFFGLYKVTLPRPANSYDAC
mmetsp:Transcript_43390/g.52604  ORF Transcript_43390/g.52604 Transcript_43390/m.52604 type:complete len:109 (+) Transcript_43390:440-766(+)